MKEKFNRRGEPMRGVTGTQKGGSAKGARKEGATTDLLFFKKAKEEGEFFREG